MISQYGTNTTWIPTSTGAILYKNMVLDYLMGTLSLLEFLIGTTLNFISILYFLSKQQQTAITIQYIFISTTDFLLSFSCLFIAIETLILAVSPNSGFFYRSPIICNIVGVIWNILPRFSIYLIAVLNVSRAITLWNPFRPAKKVGIITSILLYLILLIIQSCLPYMYSTVYIYDEMLYLCSWRFEDENLNFSENTITVLYILMVYGEFCVPVVPILTSVVLTVWCLVRGRQSCGNGALDSEKRDATVTVIILTLIYICCNFFLWTLYTADLMWFIFRWDYSIAFHLSGFQQKLINNAYFHHSVALNSVLNAIVYFVRRKNLQKFLFNFLRKYIFDNLKNKTMCVQDVKFTDQGTIGRTGYMTLSTTISVVLRSSPLPPSTSYTLTATAV